MAGPYRLTEENVKDPNQVWDGHPGVYLLRNSRKGPPRYVGRSDTDIERRLLKRAREGEYKYFSVEHKETPLEAWEREANLYHYYKGKLDNEVHPKPPEGYSCPRCSKFD